jgi:hypothetical protein
VKLQQHHRVATIALHFRIFLCGAIRYLVVGYLLARCSGAVWVKYHFCWLLHTSLSHLPPIKVSNSDFGRQLLNLLLLSACAKRNSAALFSCCLRVTDIIFFARPHSRAVGHIVGSTLERLDSACQALISHFLIWTPAYGPWSCGRHIRIWDSGAHRRLGYTWEICTRYPLCLMLIFSSYVNQVLAVPSFDGDGPRGLNESISVRGPSARLGSCQ